MATDGFRKSVDRLDDDATADCPAAIVASAGLDDDDDELFP